MSDERKYKVLMGTANQDEDAEYWLNLEIQRWTNKGYRPLGGVSVVYTSRAIVFYQAMFKNNDE